MTFDDCVNRWLFVKYEQCVKAETGVFAAPWAASVLTLADLALLLDVPAVECSPLLVLHGCAFVEVLREVGLVEPRGLHHLSLREVVLLHVAFHHFCDMPRVLPVRERNISYACALHFPFIYFFPQQVNPACQTDTVCYNIRHKAWPLRGK